MRLEDTHGYDMSKIINFIRKRKSPYTDRRRGYDAHNTGNRVIGKR